jgi:hypothetical protein
VNDQAVQLFFDGVAVFGRLFRGPRVGHYHIAQVRRLGGGRDETIQIINHPEGQNVGLGVLAAILKIEAPYRLIICDEQAHRYRMPEALATQYFLGDQLEMLVVYLFFERSVFLNA